MTVYTVVPESDANLEVQITQAPDQVVINIQPASFTGGGSGSGAVDSVNGLTGDVVLTTTNISEGDNLYYTDARVQAQIDLIDYPVDSVNGQTGAVVIETTSELYVNTQDAVTLSSANAYTDSQISSVAVPGSTDDLPEGTSNLYYTDARAQAVIDNNSAGFITDYTVTESDVTQHQTALSITESQISDLTHYTTADFQSDFANQSATDLAYDNSFTTLTATNVGAALTELAQEKVNITDMTANVRLFPTTTVSSVPGYLVQVTDQSDVRYNTVAVAVDLPEITSDDQLLGALISDAGILTGSPGVINVTTIGNIRKSGGGGSHRSAFYYTVIHRTAAGVETIMGTSDHTPEVTNTDFAEFFANCMLMNPQEFTPTDSLVVKYYSVNVSGSPNYQLQFGGVAPVRTNLPVPVTAVVHAQDAENVPVDTSGFSGNLSGADNTVQAALNTLDALTIPEAYTDAQAISALENNSDTTLTGNLTVNGDFVVLNQVKLNNFEFPVFDYGRTDQWPGATQTIDMSNAYNKIQLRGATTPTIVFDTSQFFDNTNNLRMVHFLIDYHSGAGDINWPVDLVWQGGVTPNFAGGVARDRYLLKMIGSGDRGWTAHLEEVFNANAVSPTTNLKFNKLTDLNITDGSAGQVLSTNADGTFTFIDQSGGGGGASALDDLTDVSISAVADGDILRYNGTALEWQNTNLGLSLTPTLSAEATQYLQGSASITNWGDYQDPAVYAELQLTGGTVVVTNDLITVDGSGNISWDFPPTAQDYVLKVQVQDFGDLASDVASITIAKASTTFQYWRVGEFTGVGSANFGLYNFRLYDAASQSGTAYPPTMTSDTAPAPYVASSNYSYSATYAPWKTFDAAPGGWNWWLGYTGSFADAWVQIDLGTPQNIKSLTVGPTYTQGITGCKVWASDTGAFAGEEVLIAVITGTGVPAAIYNLG